jgi:hypothetical protein
VETSLSQQVGRFAIHGIGFSDLPCDETPRPWRAEVLPDNGKFAGGKAVSVTFAVAYGPFECGTDFEDRVVHVRGK